MRGQVLEMHWLNRHRLQRAAEAAGLWMMTIPLRASPDGMCSEADTDGEANKDASVQVTVCCEGRSIVVRPSREVIA